MDLEGLKLAALDAKRAADAVLDGMGHLKVVSDALRGQGVPCRFEVGDGQVSLIADFSGVLTASRLFGEGAVAVATPAPEAESQIAVIRAPAEVAKVTPMAVPSAEKPKLSVGASQFAPAWDDESIKRLSDFWRQGLSIVEIAEKMGRAEKQVQNKTYSLRKKGKLPERPEPGRPAAKIVKPAEPAAVEITPTAASMAADTRVAEDPALILRGAPAPNEVTRPGPTGDALVLLKLNPTKASAWAQFLKTLPEDDFWTPRLDLRLITNICAGKAKGSTTVDIGCDWSGCVARFKVLHPFEPTPTSQGALIKALRERASG